MRAEILGVEVDGLRAAELVPAVSALVERGHATVAYANIHVVNCAQRDAALRSFLASSDLCYCDGNGVRLGAQLLGTDLPERMTGADWIWDLAAAAAERRWRVYWIGGEPGVTERAAAKLTARHPRLEVGTDHGFHPHTGPEDDACIARINAFAPHVLLVGMGTPVQERWVAARRGRIDAPVVWCLGATADFVAGEKPRPGPEWMVQNHEWMTRLIAEPRRLWRRYLVGNSVFLLRIGRERVRRRLSGR